MVNTQGWKEEEWYGYSLHRLRNGQDPLPAHIRHIRKAFLPKKPGSANHEIMELALFMSLGEQWALDGLRDRIAKERHHGRALAENGHCYRYGEWDFASWDWIAHNCPDPEIRTFARNRRRAAVMYHGFFCRDWPDEPNTSRRWSCLGPHNRSTGLGTSAFASLLSKIVEDRIDAPYIMEPEDRGWSIPNVSDVLRQRDVRGMYADLVEPLRQAIVDGDPRALAEKWNELHDVEPLPHMEETVVLHGDDEYLAWRDTGRKKPVMAVLSCDGYVEPGYKAIVAPRGSSDATATGYAAEEPDAGPGVDVQWIDDGGNLRAQRLPMNWMSWRPTWPNFRVTLGRDGRATVEDLRPGATKPEPTPTDPTPPEPPRERGGLLGFLIRIIRRLFGKSTRSKIDNHS